MRFKVEIDSAWRCAKLVNALFKVREVFGKQGLRAVNGGSKKEKAKLLGLFEALSEEEKIEFLYSAKLIQQAFMGFAFCKVEAEGEVAD